MAVSLEKVCSRCGTPFTAVAGKLPMNCPVCGQLRPDLDVLTHDEPVALSRPTKPRRDQESIPSFLQPPTGVSWPTVSGLPIDFPMPAAGESPTLLDRVGVVLLVTAPMGAAMAGLLGMLAHAPDLASGSWYAAATMAIVLAAGTLTLGLGLSGLFFLARLRRRFVIRLCFILGTAAAVYLGLYRLIPRVQVQPDSLPVFRLTK
jgi:hypothetical protein